MLAGIHQRVFLIQGYNNSSKVRTYVKYHTSKHSRISPFYPTFVTGTDMKTESIILLLTVLIACLLKQLYPRLYKQLCCFESYPGSRTHFISVEVSFAWLRCLLSGECQNQRVSVTLPTP